MSSLHSNQSSEASALSWTIVRYGSPLTYATNRHLQVPQRTKANKQAIELLAPRVKTLSTSLCRPVSEGDTNEEARRKELER